MSIVLSIYSQKGFREIALPERGPKELRILLRREIFDLSSDLTLAFEKRQNGKGESVWNLIPEGGLLLMNGRRYRSVPVSGRMQLEAELRSGDRVTILSEEQTDPFTAYQKYTLGNCQQIRIGWDDDNDICYRTQGGRYVTSHHCALTLRNGRWELRDSSTNGTYINFKRVYDNTILRYGDSIRIMRLNIIFLGNMLAVNPCEGLMHVKIPRVQGMEQINSLAKSGRASSGEKILFHRSPRNLRRLHTEAIEIEPPPQPQEQNDLPLAMQIGPSLTMAIPMMLGSGLSVLGSNSGSGAFMYMGMITAVASAVIGSFWALANVRHAGKTRRQAENRRFESYSEYLIRMRDRIERQYKENADALRECSLSGVQCCALNGTSALLWNRNAFHADFLAVRLGMGDLPFHVPIVIPKERFTMVNDNLAEKPRVLQENFRMLKDVPVSVDLLEHHLVGIADGETRKASIATAQAMIAQIAAANCYTDVKIAIVCDESSDIDRDAWNFALWLPHVWSGDKKIRYMAMNRAERGEVFYALAQILRNRSEENKETRSLNPRIVLFVSDPTLLDGEAIAHYIFDRETDLGLSTVLLAGRPEELPNECECVIECGGQYQGIYDTHSGRAYGTPVQFDRVPAERLWNFAKGLTRIEVVSSDQEGEIPNSLTFFDMYGIERPEQLDASVRWQKSNVISSMRALVGFRSGNTPCYLDINEKYHGPHGLVAGTTGSGKSETLQTYILSLAANYSPEDVSFFVIDYKGGGMANLFDGLPHMIGSISNLSGNQIHRAMVSIRSENRRRQRIFAEYGVNSINGYTALYKNGDAREPVPHLFIIVDEFAELKQDQPDFMKELISVSQVGRSLGVHMILSTQRPAGSVDPSIWANSKFHLCLRVQDRQDSMDMLHRPDAAYLTQAGRAYLQVGNDELFELFQSGWSGAPYDEELGGSLLIAQMLSVTGKVDLVGNRAKMKRKEALKRRWLAQLSETLNRSEQETGLSVNAPGFSFNQEPVFRDVFYRLLHEQQPEFEESPFNNARIQDFIDLYRQAQGETDARIAEIENLAASSGGEKRLPELRVKTQLEVTVNYLAAVAQKAGLKPVHKLWLPVLPSQLYLDAMESFRRTAFNGKEWEHHSRFQLSAVIGMADDPANQEQFPVSLDFAQGGHHLLIGTVATGKSTFAQSAVYSLLCAYSPEQLNLYCLDFSSKMLSVFADAPHTGGYMDESDVKSDKISKFFTLMNRILDERRVRFAGTSFADAMNHNGWTDPAILIVIDNYGSFNEKTEELYEAHMSRLVKEGNAYGIYLLATAGGVSMREMPSRLADNFRTGLALEMPDPFAYGDVLHVSKPEVLPESRVKGRGLMFVGKHILEFQTAVAAPSKDGETGVESQPDAEHNPPLESPERNDRIKLAVARMKAAWKGRAATMIPSIPKEPFRSDFTALAAYRTALADTSLLPIGYNYDNAELYSLNLMKSYTYLVSGTKGSGKSVFMENLMLTCSERKEEVHIIELKARKFERTAKTHGWKRYTNREELTDFFEMLLKEIQEKRNSIKTECREQESSEEELFRQSQKNTRMNVFIATPLALAEELTALDDAVPASVPAAQTNDTGTSAPEGGKETSGDSTQLREEAEEVKENIFAQQMKERIPSHALDKSVVNAQTSADTAEPATANAETPADTAQPVKENAEAETANVTQPPTSPRMSQSDMQILLDVLCDHGEGINVFLFVEVSDKEAEGNLTGYAWFRALSERQTGIRFGGRFDQQKILPFDNINWKTKGAVMRTGIGQIASYRPDESPVRVVIPRIHNI